MISLFLTNGQSNLISEVKWTKVLPYHKILCAGKYLDLYIPLQAYKICHSFFKNSIVYVKESFLHNIRSELGSEFNIKLLQDCGTESGFLKGIFTLVLYCMEF